MKKKINVAILGTGNIGTDLFFKIMKSKFLNCVLYSGRNIYSNGFKKVKKFIKNKKNYNKIKHLKISNNHIKSIVTHSNSLDLIFDCSSAKFHDKNRSIFKKLNSKIINLTPSGHGQMCVPAININYSDNFFHFYRLNFRSFKIFTILSSWIIISNDTRNRIFI